MNYRPVLVNGRRITTPTYTSWQMMRDRCLNPRSKDYRHYGGRGITIDQRWDDFDRFLSDMGPCPPGHTLERRDNDAPYGPSNCCWATRKEQVRNRRCTKLTLNAATKIRAACADGARQVDVAHRFGVSQAMVSMIVRGVVWCA